MPVDSALDYFRAKLSEVMDSAVPSKLIKLHTAKLAPWLSPELRAEARLVTQCYRRFRRNKNSTYLTAYRRARDLHRSNLDVARINYYRSRIANIPSAAVWKELRHLGLLRDTSASPLAVSPNELNTFFASVSTTSGSPDIGTPILPLEQEDLLSFLEVTPVAVQGALLSIKSNACGADNLSRRLIVPLVDLLLPVITSIYNLSIRSSIFPTSWKQALIVPVSKTASPSAVGDYRPIALLPYLGKALERLVFDQLTAHLERNDLLDAHQCGFRQGHSTQTALLKLVNDIRLNMDQRKLTVLILFDFSKAFDTVNHHLLINKLLRLYKFSTAATMWIKSYLMGRTQAVKTSDEHLSNWLNTNAGVPQGSILGPLLFSLFVNDIGNVILNSRHLLYADDLQIFTSCPLHQLPDTISRLNQDVKRIETWASDNQLHLNLSKTKAIVFGARRFINQLDLESLPALGTSGIKIPFVSSVKNLGVILDSKLTFGDHVDYVASKVNSTFYQLYSFRRYTDFTLRKSLASALVHPHLSYCLGVLNGAGVVLDNRLQRLSNRCVRYVTGCSRDTPVSNLRGELGWLTIDLIRENILLNLVFKCLHYRRPGYLVELLTEWLPPRPGRGERARRLLVVPSYRTDCCRHAFGITGPELWNSLPLQLRDCDSPDIFRRSLVRWQLRKMAESPSS